MRVAGARPAGCASDLALEELIAGDLDGDGAGDGAHLRGHVAGCARCRERMEALSREPVLAPPPALRAALDTRVRARRRIIGVAGGLAAAAAAVVALVTTGPGDQRARDNGARVKGALALTVHIKHRDGTVASANGEASLRPGEEMRFSLAVAAAGYAVVLGLDAAPSVTVYVPAAGATAGAVRVEPPGPVVLPGSIVADAVAGDERVFAVVCPAPVEPAALRQRALGALGAAGGHPAAVAALGSGCLEQSVLLHKGAGAAP